MEVLKHLPEDNAGRLNPGITREEAFTLLRQYNKEPFHIQHGETMEAVMRHFARILGYDEEEEFWGLVGLLHDLDFEAFPEEHCIKVREIMGTAGINPEILRAVVSHAYGFTQHDVPPSMRWKKCCMQQMN